MPWIFKFINAVSRVKYVIVVNIRFRTISQCYCYSTDRRHSGMEGQMFADQKLCLTSCILMVIYSNLDNVTIFAFFPYWDSVVKDPH